jgi:rRNA-processing protein FCF1
MEGIIVDTSSILFALSNKVDIFDAIGGQLRLTPVISRGVVSELSRLSKTRKASGRHASVALELIGRHNVRIERDSGYVDSWILSAAHGFSCVCTNDTRLREELRKAGIKVYVMSRSGELR